MEVFSRSAQEDTPEVHLNYENGTLAISGRSLPEDAAEFYAPIYEWFQDYVDDPKEETVLNIHLEYVNSSSVKRIFAILCLLEEIEPYQNTILVKWSYNRGDELMKEKGEEFDDYLEVAFEMIAV